MAMGRPDGRLEAGQRLHRSISARAWNRAQDAADIVLGERTGFEAGPRLSKGLPQLRITLPNKGFFGRALRVSGNTVTSTSDLFSVSSQTSLNTEWNYSDNEKLLPAFGEVIAGQFGSGTSWTDSIVTGDGGSPWYGGPIAICVDNNSREYAVTGMAITRVRVFNHLHRYAHFATEIPGGGSLTSQNAAAAGTLDSSFHGPVKVLGYALLTPAGGRVRFGFLGSPVLTWPNYELRWALVQF